MPENENRSASAESPPSPSPPTIADKYTAAAAREEDILKVAVVKALGQVQANPTVENLKNHEAAKKSLETFNRRRQLDENPESVIFKTVAEAFRYAVENGYLRTRQTMDNHIEAGFLPRLPDGGLAKTAVDAYLAMQSGETSGTISEAQALEIRDQTAKTKKTEAQAEVWDLRARREKGELLPRSEIEGMLAQRAQFLRQDLESFFRVLSPEIINLVGGDEGRVFDLTEFGLDRLEEFLDRYSRPLAVNEIAPPASSSEPPAVSNSPAGSQKQKAE